MPPSFQLAPTTPYVFVDGCFDPLHAGHLRLIHHALNQYPGRIPIILVATDAYIRKIKGPHPHQHQGHRAAVVQALDPRLVVVIDHPEVYEHCLAALHAGLDAILIRGEPPTATSFTQCNAFYEVMRTRTIILGRTPGISSSRLRASNTLSRRIWSPERLRAAASMLEGITQVCIASAIHPWIDSGTLLGHVRHQGVVPWDDDVDMGFVSAGDRDLTRTHQVLRPHFEVVRFAHSRFGILLKVFPKGCRPQVGVPFVDLFQYHPGMNAKTGMPTLTCKGLPALPMHGILPLKPAVFEGAQVLIPHQPRVMLDAYYPEWETRHASGNWNHLEERPQRVQERRMALPQLAAHPQMPNTKLFQERHHQPPG